MNKFNLTDNQATSIASEFVGQKVYVKLDTMKS